MLRKKQIILLFAVTFAVSLIALVIYHPLPFSKDVYAEPLKEKTQLQEELGEALLNYYIYGKNEKQCRDLIADLNKLENYDCSTATGIGRQ